MRASVIYFFILNQATLGPLIGRCAYGTRRGVEGEGERRGVEHLNNSIVGRQRDASL